MAVTYHVLLRQACERARFLLSVARARAVEAVAKLISHLMPCHSWQTHPLLLTKVELSTSTAENYCTWNARARASQTRSFSSFRLHL